MKPHNYFVYQRVRLFALWENLMRTAGVCAPSFVFVAGQCPLTRVQALLL